MKQSKYIIIGCLSLMLGFSSCEMKDEILGSGETSAEMGTLEVALSSVYNNGEIVVGRADENAFTDNGEIQGSFDPAELNTDNYTLIVTNTTTQEEVKKGLVSELKGEDGIVAIPLPVGEYNVKAYNYDGANVNVSTRPYFEGTSDFSIEAGKGGAAVNLKCKLACVEVAINLTESFLDAFRDDYAITVDNGESANQVFTKDNIGSKFYFKTPANKNSLTVSVKATSQEGNPIDMSYTVQKPADAEGGTANLANGDAFLINLTEAEVTDSHVSFVGITVDLTFTQEGSTIEIPVENITGDNLELPGGEEGGEEGDAEQPVAEITFTGLPATYIGTAGVGSLDGLEDVVIKVSSTSTGIKSLKVTISGAITDLASGLLGTEPFDVCNLDDNLKGVLIGLGLITEEDYTNLHAGTVKEFTFKLGGLLVLVPQVTGAGTQSVFNLSVDDGVTTNSGDITVNVQ